MERYNRLGIIRTVIFSLILVFGLWGGDFGALTCPPYHDLRALGCIFGWFVVSVGGLGLVISLIVWMGEASKKHRIKKIGEESKKIVDYLKKSNSGITQLKLASVLQIDRTKMKKCLNHLEWLGVVEKKKLSAEEMLFFYKKDY